MTDKSENQLYILFLGLPYFPIKTRSPYPKDLSKIVRQPPPAPYSSVTDEHPYSKDYKDNKETMNPNLPSDVDVNNVLPYADPGDYGPPTYPRRLPSERTPLLQ